MIKMQVRGLKEAISEMGVRKALIPAIVADAVSDIGDAFIDELRGHVEAQDFNFKALSFSYRARKRRNKEKWWIHEGTLLDLFEKRGSGVTVTVGAFEDTPYKPGVSAGQVAMWLEQGAPEANIPARPLFRRTKAQFNRSMAVKVALASAAAAIASAKRRNGRKK